MGVCQFDNLFVNRREYFYPKIIRLLIVLKYCSDLSKYRDIDVFFFFNLVHLTFLNCEM